MKKSITCILSVALMLLFGASQVHATCYSNKGGYVYGYKIDSSARVLEITRVSKKGKGTQAGCPSHEMYQNFREPHWEDSSIFKSKSEADADRREFKIEYQDAGYRIEPRAL